jgi:hypothetical protein
METSGSRTTANLGYILPGQGEKVKDLLESSGHYMDFDVTLGVRPGSSYKYLSVHTKADVTEKQLMKAAMMVLARNFS